MDAVSLLRPGLFGVLAAAVVLLVTAKFPSLRRVRAGWALAAGLVAVRLGVALPSGFPPIDGPDWLVYLCLVVAAHVAVDQRRGAGLIEREIGRLVLGLGAAWLLLSPLRSWREAPLLIVAHGVGVAALTSALVRLAPLGPRWLLLGGAGVASGAAAAILGQFSGINGGIVIAGLALTATACVIGTWRRPSDEVAAGFAAAFAPLLALAVLTAGAYSSDFPNGGMWLLFAVAPCAWIGQLPLFAARPAWQRVALGAVAALIVAGGAYLATAPGPADDDPYAAYK